MSSFKYFGWLVVLIFFCTAAGAAPAFTDRQEEQGIARISLGEIELVALEDSPARMDFSLFSGPLAHEERKSLLPDGYAPASINVFAVIAAGQTVLIDSGNGQNATPAGKMLKQLAGAGIAPGQVDIALLTHLHFDHISGLLDDGGAVLPKAGIYISSPELRFWAAPELARDEKFGANADLVSKVLQAYWGADHDF